MTFLNSVFVVVTGGFILSTIANVISQRIQLRSIKDSMVSEGKARAIREKLDDERHEQNVERLEQIGSDVRRINGTVGKHEERIATHADEIRRLRGQN